MIADKKLFYGILAAAIVFIGTGLFIIMSKSGIPVQMIETDPLSQDRIVVKQSGGAGLLIAECSDNSYITKTADYIIEGTVEDVETKWNEEKTSIFTYTDLRIENYAKGIPLANEKLQIATPGGTIGEISQVVEDQPIFHEGKKVRIYFQETNGEFSIVCALNGVEDIWVN